MLSCDIISDPAEKMELLEKQPDIAAELRKELEPWMSTERGNPAKIELSEKEKEELRSLGYLR